MALPIQERREHCPYAVFVLFAAVAGFVDTAGFLALFGLYPAHLTGNLVALAGPGSWPNDPLIVARLLVIPAYVFAVALSVVVAHLSRRRKGASTRALLFLLATMLALFTSVGGSLQSIDHSPHSASVVVTGCLGVGAVGVQNVTHRELFPTRRPTTVMTGNLTQLITHAVQIWVLLPWSGGRGLDAAARRALWDAAVPLGSFFLGAALGATLTQFWGIWSVVVPAVCVAGLWASSLFLQQSTGDPGPPRRCAPPGLVPHDSLRVSPRRAPAGP